MRYIACVFILHFSILQISCTHTVIKRVARYDATNESATALAPRTGAYKVKYVSPTSKDANTVADSARMVREGERLGFRRSEDGRIIAVAGDEEFELHALPADAMRVCWYHRSKEPTMFAMDVANALQTSGDIGKGAAFAAGAGAVIVGGAYLNGLATDDECDPPPKKHHHSGRH